jgi:hypothetical protein
MSNKMVTTFMCVEFAAEHPHFAPQFKLAKNFLNNMVSVDDE